MNTEWMHSEFWYCLGIMGGISYVGDKVGRTIQPLVYKYVQKPRVVKALKRQLAEADAKNDKKTYGNLALRYFLTTGEYPVGYTPPEHEGDFGPSRNIVGVPIVIAGYTNDSKP